jgi:predicted ATP-grasp superfamily ATP-dependent carboligase
VDLPYIAFRDAIGQPVEPVTRWKNDVKWIWMTQDVFAARELNRQQQMTFRQWLQSIKGKRVHAVFAGDDLRPVAYYLAGFLRTHLPKLLARLLSGGAKR